MQQEPLSKKSEKTVVVEMPISRLRRPFPLIWGLGALALFVLFAFVTQLQFNRINNEKLDDQEDKQYETDLRVYETAVKAHEDCLTSIEIRETYRKIFGGIEVMFQSTADYPVSQYPDNDFAQQYHTDLTQDIEKYITQPVAEGLPPKKAADCPPIPESEPERPNNG